MKLILVIFAFFITVLSLSNVNAKKLKGKNQDVPSEKEKLVGEEQKIIQAIAGGAKFSPEHCGKLFDLMKKGQSTKASSDITAMTEAAAESTFRKVDKKNQEASKNSLIAYVQNSYEINSNARADNISPLVQQLDKTLLEMQKARVQMAKGSKKKFGGKTIDIAPIPNVRVTYRMNSYGPKIHGLMPFKQKDADKRIKLHSIITDKAFLSTSANRQYLTDPYDPIEQKKLPLDNIVIQMVMLGYTGTPIGIDGIKTSNKNMKKNHMETFSEKDRAWVRNERLKKSDVKKMSELEKRAAHIRAGEGEVLYGRGTKWSVKKIDTSGLSEKSGKKYKTVLVCLEQIDNSRDKYRSSFDGSAVEMKPTSSNDFAKEWERSGPKQRPPTV